MANHKDRKTQTRTLGTLGVAGLAAALLLSLPATARAGEPLNNTPPWSTLNPNQFDGDAQVFTTTAATGNLYSQWINQTGDVDYIVLSCGNAIGGKGTVKQVQMSLTHANGDLDMTAYTTSGAVIASSTSTTNTETINVAAQNRGAIVLKVYGYNKAVNLYGLTLTCQ
jgi:hypothetical protein